ncbi:MAG: methyltransferase domain-containing protein [Bacillota bacterium]
MLMTASSSKQSFRNHLARIGFAMGKPPAVVMDELRKHMGPQRFAEYQRIAGGARRGGDEPQNRIYDFMRDMREANLLRSLSPDVTLDTSYYLYEQALPHLTPGKRVIELACWTGGLASFTAQNHPNCTVIGVDRARQVVDVDRTFYSNLTNLSFSLWDYRHKKPEDLEPADVVLCSLGVNNDCPPGAYETLNPHAVRQSSGYQRERGEADAYFQNWRQATKDGGILFTILRVFTFPRFLAFMDAAQHAGWNPLLPEFTFVRVPANNEAIPSLLFKAEPSEPVSEDAALSHWIRISSGHHQIARLAGPAALGVYRAFGDKQVLAQRKFRNEAGLMTQEELGICGAFGYIYGQDARPDYRLVLMDIAEAEGQRRIFTEPPPAQMFVTGLASGSNVVMSLGGFSINPAS